MTKDYVKGISALYGVLGAGLGLMVLFVGSVAAPVLLSPDLQNAADQSPVFEEYLAQVFVNNVAVLAVMAAPLLAVGLALFVGLYVDRQVDVGDRTATVIAGLGTFVGSVVSVAITGFLASTQASGVESIIGDAGLVPGEDYPESAAEAVRIAQFPENGMLYYGAELDFAALVLLGVAAGVAAAAVAVGSVYVSRNFLR